MPSLGKYLRYHLAMSVLIALPLALIGLGGATYFDVDQIVTSAAIGGGAFVTYWAARAKDLRAALAARRGEVPTADDLIDDALD